MKKYNFDEVLDRRKTHSKKWTDWSSYGLESSDDILPLWIADMDFKCEERILQALHDTVDYGAIGYDGPPSDYYEPFIEWKKKRNNWEVKEEWFLPSPGIVPAISNAVICMTEKGDKILIQPPVYYPFFTAVEINGRTLVESTLVEGKDRYKIDFDDLDKKLEGCKLMIMSNPHNPIGRAYSKEELEKIGNLCVKHGVILIADEIHSDLMLDGNEHISVATLSKEIADTTITMCAPSKTFNIAGLAQSVIIITNEKLRQQFKDGLAGFGLMHMSSFGISGFNAAYKYGEEWLDQALEYIQGNVDYVMDFLETRLPKVKAYRPEATFLMWLDFREVAENEDELNDIMLNKCKMLMDTGSHFGKTGDRFYRLNVGCTRATLVEAMERLKKVFG